MYNLQWMDGFENQIIKGLLNWKESFYDKSNVKNTHLRYLGVQIQPCFGVVYHELTTLRQAYFEGAALAVRAK